MEGCAYTSCPPHLLLVLLKGKDYTILKCYCQLLSLLLNKGFCLSVKEAYIAKDVDKLPMCGVGEGIGKDKNRKGL